MRMRCWASVLVLAALLPIASSWSQAPVTAQDKPSAAARVAPKEIEELAKQLGSDDARTREAATKALLKIGDDALPHLEVAMTGAENLELKRRTEGLYAEISAKAPGPKLPDGVTHIKLPPGRFDLKPVKVEGKVFMRITAGKTVIETQKFYLGDRWGCHPFEVIDGQIHWWAGTLAGMGKSPGTSIYMKSGYVPVDQLKPGSLLITSPSLVHQWGNDAIRKDGPK